MTEKITSPKNPKIKHLANLYKKSSDRKEAQVVIIEGVREAELAVSAGFVIKSLYWCPEITPKHEIVKLVHGVEVIEVSREVFASLAYRETTEGIIALAQSKQTNLSQLRVGPNPLVLVIEAVEKPGNLGAMLRTADAAAVDAIILCDPQVDVYNPNVVRSSVGCVFTNQIATATSAEAIAWLKEKQINIFPAALSPSATAYSQIDFKQGSAIVVGTEATGLSSLWLAQGKHVIIPMRGKIDSLNVSNACAVLLFEALRQRTM